MQHLLGGANVVGRKAACAHILIFYGAIRSAPDIYGFFSKNLKILNIHLIFAILNFILYTFEPLFLFFSLKASSNLLVCYILFQIHIVEILVKLVTL